MMLKTSSPQDAMAKKPVNLHKQIAMGAAGTADCMCAGMDSDADEMKPMRRGAMPKRQGSMLAGYKR